MAIKASCPSCQQSYTVADTQLGKKVRCRDCAYVFEVQAEAETGVTDNSPPPARLSGSGTRGRTNPDVRDEEEVRPTRRREDEEDDRPSRREREEEDDRPSRRRARDDYEDDRPSRRDRDDYEEDRSRRRTKTKRGGIPLWVWLIGGLGGGFILMAVCGVVLLFVLGVFRLSNPVTMENYAKLNNNMSESEVRAIMGRPTQSVNAGQANMGGMFANPGMRGNVMTGKTLVWKNGDDQISCTFLNDKLWIKTAKIGNQINLN